MKYLLFKLFALDSEAVLGDYAVVDARGGSLVEYPELLRKLDLAFQICRKNTQL
jgi:hypothetical protein